MARTTDDIVAAGRRAERRRRAGFASAGAAGLVAVAATAAIVVPTLGAGQKSSVMPAQAGAATTRGVGATGLDARSFTFTFAGYDAGTLHVQDPIAVSTAYQIASVYSDNHTSNDKPQTAEEAEAQGGSAERNKNAHGKKPTLFAYLTVYRPGVFDPAGIKDGKDVTVAGHRAVQATLPDDLDPRKPADEGNKLFAWEYADNAWAAVTSISTDQATPSFGDLAGLVEGLRPSPPKPALVPFTVSYVPDGYVPLQTGTHAMPGLIGIATAREGDYGGATYTKPALPTSGLTAPYDAAPGVIRDGFHIFVNRSTSANQSPEPGTTRCYTPAKRVGAPERGSFCNVWSADGKVVLQVTATGLEHKLPSVELEKIAQGITVANVKDESTWTPAANALQP